MECKLILRTRARTHTHTHTHIHTHRHTHTNVLLQTVFTRKINKPLLTSYGCKPSVATCPVRYLASHCSLLRGCITNDVNCTWDIILHSCTSGHVLFRLSRATALLTFTQEVHGSNLHWDTDYPQVFRGLRQSLSANTFKWVTIPSFLSLSNTLFAVSTERVAIYR